MKVLYDLQAFDMQTHGGVSRCFAELYSHRPAFVDAHISVKETDNVYLQELGFPPKGTLYNLKSATIIQYTIKGRFMSR